MPTQVVLPSLTPWKSDKLQTIKIEQDVKIVFLLFFFFPSFETQAIIAYAPLEIRRDCQPGCDTQMVISLVLLQQAFASLTEWSHSYMLQCVSISSGLANPPPHTHTHTAGARPRACLC